MMSFDNKENMIKYMVNFVKEHDDVNIICDHDTVLKLWEEFSKDNIEYKDYIGIDYQSDENEYNFGYIKDACLCIEPLKRNDKYYYTESDYTLIDNNVLSDNEELLEYLYAEKEMEILNYSDEIGYEEQCECGNCENCCCKDNDDMNDEEDWKIELIKPMAESFSNDLKENYYNFGGRKELFMYYAKQLADNMYRIGKEDAKLELGEKVFSLLENENVEI